MKYFLKILFLLLILNILISCVSQSNKNDSCCLEVSSCCSEEEMCICD